MFVGSSTRWIWSATAAGSVSPGTSENLEPTVPKTGIHLSARLDKAVIGSILRGSTDGIWNDTPVDLYAAVDCPPGRHVLDLEVTHVAGAWGIPYVGSEGAPPSEELRVDPSFLVTEIWNVQS